MSTQQIAIMLELQDSINTQMSLNAYTDANWRKHNHEFYRAIWIECAEILNDHYGWKWWKAQHIDIQNIVVELVDIWHFGLSMLLQDAEDVQALAADVNNRFVIQTDDSDFRLLVEEFVAATLSDRRFHLDLFGRLMGNIGMTFEQLYRYYIGKNVLNFFRQEHGYLDGSYRKHWYDGREDNDHMSELCQSLDIQDAAFKDNLYKALGERYEQQPDTN